MDLSILERDLAEARELLLKSAFSGHRLLADQTRQIGELPLARLLLLSASLGSYNAPELKPVAAGLELLLLAVEELYRAPEERAVDRNRSLVTADYFYARAIALAVTLDRGYVVERMVGAIADVAEAEVPVTGNGSAPRVVSKGVSLFTAAAALGSSMSGCSADTEDALTRFAVAHGQLWRASRSATLAELPEREEYLSTLKGDALEAAQALPQPQRGALERLVAAYPPA